MARDPARIPRLTQRLSVLWQAQSDLRLGQLITSINARIGTMRDPFYTEDDEIERVIDEMIEENAEREFSTKSIRG